MVTTAERSATERENEIMVQTPQDSERDNRASERCQQQTPPPSPPRPAGDAIRHEEDDDQESSGAKLIQRFREANPLMKLVSHYESMSPLIRQFDSSSPWIVAACKDSPLRLADMQNQTLTPESIRRERKTKCLRLDGTARITRGSPDSVDESTMRQLPNIDEDVDAEEFLRRANINAAIHPTAGYVEMDRKNNLLTRVLVPTRNGSERTVITPETPTYSKTVSACDMEGRTTRTQKTEVQGNGLLASRSESSGTLSDLSAFQSSKQQSIRDAPFQSRHSWRQDQLNDKDDLHDDEGCSCTVVGPTPWGSRSGSTILTYTHTGTVSPLSSHQTVTTTENQESSSFDQARHEHQEQPTDSDRAHPREEWKCRPQQYNQGVSQPSSFPLSTSHECDQHDRALRFRHQVPHGEGNFRVSRVLKRPTTACPSSSSSSGGSHGLETTVTCTDEDAAHQDHHIVPHPHFYSKNPYGRDTPQPQQEMPSAVVTGKARVISSISTDVNHQQDRIVRASFSDTDNATVAWSTNALHSSQTVHGEDPAAIDHNLLYRSGSWKSCEKCATEKLPAFPESLRSFSEERCVGLQNLPQDDGLEARDTPRHPSLSPPTTPLVSNSSSSFCSSHGAPPSVSAEVAKWRRICRKEYQERLHRQGAANHPSSRFSSDCGNASIEWRSESQRRRASVPPGVEPRCCHRVCSTPYSSKWGSMEYHLPKSLPRPTSSPRPTPHRRPLNGKECLRFQQQQQHEAFQFYDLTTNGDGSNSGSQLNEGTGSMEEEGTASFSVSSITQTEYESLLTHPGVTPSERNLSDPRLSGSQCYIQSSSSLLTESSSRSPAIGVSGPAALGFSGGFGLSHHDRGMSIVSTPHQQSRRISTIDGLSPPSLPVFREGETEEPENRTVESSQYSVIATRGTSSSSESRSGGGRFDEVTSGTGGSSGNYRTSSSTSSVTVSPVQHHLQHPVKSRIYNFQSHTGGMRRTVGLDRSHERNQERARGRQEQNQQEQLSYASPLPDDSHDSDADVNHIDDQSEWSFASGQNKNVIGCEKPRAREKKKEKKKKKKAKIERSNDFEELQKRERRQNESERSNSDYSNDELYFSASSTGSSVARLPIPVLQNTEAKTDPVKLRPTIETVDQRSDFATEIENDQRKIELKKNSRMLKDKRALGGRSSIEELPARQKRSGIRIKERLRWYHHRRQKSAKEREKLTSMERKKMASLSKEKHPLPSGEVFRLDTAVRTERDVMDESTFLSMEARWSRVDRRLKETGISVTGLPVLDTDLLNVYDVHPPTDGDKRKRVRVNRVDEGLSKDQLMDLHLSNVDVPMTLVLFDRTFEELLKYKHYCSRLHEFGGNHLRIHQLMDELKSENKKLIEKVGSQHRLLNDQNFTASKLFKASVQLRHLETEMKRLQQELNDERRKSRMLLIAKRKQTTAMASAQSEIDRLVARDNRAKAKATETLKRMHEQKISNKAKLLSHPVQDNETLEMDYRVRSTADHRGRSLPRVATLRAGRAVAAATTLMGSDELRNLIWCFENQIDELMHENRSLQQMTEKSRRCLDSNVAGDSTISDENRVAAASCKAQNQGSNFKTLERTQASGVLKALATTTTTMATSRSLNGPATTVAGGFSRKKPTDSSAICSQSESIQQSGAPLSAALPLGDGLANMNGNLFNWYLNALQSQLKNSVEEKTKIQMQYEDQINKLRQELATSATSAATQQPQPQQVSQNHPDSSCPMPEDFCLALPAHAMNSETSQSLVDSSTILQSVELALKETSSDEMRKTTAEMIRRDRKLFKCGFLDRLNALKMSQLYNIVRGCCTTLCLEDPSQLVEVTEKLGQAVIQVGQLQRVVKRVAELVGVQRYERFEDIARIVLNWRTAILNTTNTSRAVLVLRHSVIELLLSLAQQEHQNKRCILDPKGFDLEGTRKDTLYYVMWKAMIQRTASFSSGLHQDLCSSSSTMCLVEGMSGEIANAMKECDTIELAQVLDQITKHVTDQVHHSRDTQMHEIEGNIPNGCPPDRFAFIVQHFMREFKIPRMELCDAAIERIQKKIKEHTRVYRSITSVLRLPVQGPPIEVIQLIKELASFADNHRQCRQSFISDATLPHEVRAVMAVFAKLQRLLNLGLPPPHSDVTDEFFYGDQYDHYFDEEEEEEEEGRECKDAIRMKHTGHSLLHRQRNDQQKIRHEQQEDDGHGLLSSNSSGSSLFSIDANLDSRPQWKSWGNACITKANLVSAYLTNACHQSRVKQRDVNI